jgi:hypothetical protein
MFRRVGLASYYSTRYDPLKTRTSDPVYQLFVNLVMTNDSTIVLQ